MTRCRDATRIHSDMPAMQLSGGRADADRCLSILLRLQRLRRKAQAPGWRLLRVLLFRVRALSAGSSEWKVLQLGEKNFVERIIQGGRRGIRHSCQCDLSRT